MDNRVKLIMRTSVLGIFVNVLLAVFKLVLGTIAGAISIVSDGINNLSDAAGSIITIVGTALAAKPADKKHPFGYGRMEYLTSLVISGIVMYAGITTAIEGIKKIISPEESDYASLTLIIIAIAVVVKLILALYTQRVGKKANSDSLIASGKEAILDVMVSLSTLVAAFIFIFFGISLEAYLCVIISAIIIKTGVELLSETVSKILGEPGEVQLAIDVKKTIAEFPEVNGAFDLVINDYGPGYYLASVHTEVDEKMTADKLDKLSRDIADRVLKEHSVVLSAIGFYSKNRSDERVIEMEKTIRDIVLSKEYIKGMHGFYVDFDSRKIRFDLVVSLDAADRRKTYGVALEAVKANYPEYDIAAGFDMDFNEIK